MFAQLTPEEREQLAGLVSRKAERSTQGRHTFLGLESDTHEGLQAEFLKAYTQDGKIHSLIQEYLTEPAKQILQKHRRDYVLDAEQLKLLHGIVKGESYRDGSGNYWVLGESFDSLEAAKGRVRAECELRHMPPLSVFALYKHEQAPGVKPPTIIEQAKLVFITPVTDASTKLERIWYRVRRLAKRIRRWLNRAIKKLASIRLTWREDE